MRERAIKEFESVFEQASIPVLDIREVALKRIAAVLKGSPLDETIVTLAAHLKERFGAQVEVHWVAAAKTSLEAARGGGLQPADQPFASTAELVGQVSIGRSQLVLVPEPQDPIARVVDLDALIQGTRSPILLIREPITDPGDVFRKVLHSLTGNFQQKENFAYSFTLVREHGTLVLLHTIDVQDLEEVRQALQVSPTLDSGEREELLDRMAHHGERYLKAVVATSREMPCDVTYRLRVGEVIPTVRRELERGDYGLLVVGHHREGHSHIDAQDYQLMRSVRNIAVLAL